MGVSLVWVLIPHTLLRLTQAISFRKTQVLLGYFLFISFRKAGVVSLN